MNRYHGLKFMLSVVTLWLAFAVASPAQNSSCPGNATWASDCATAAGQPMNRCLLVNGVCQMQVSETSDAATSTPASSTSNIGVVCFSIPAGSSVPIQWQPAASNAGFVIQFGSSSPLLDNNKQTIEAVAAATSDGYKGGNIPSTADNQGGTCYEYAVAYCPPNQTCFTADPRVWVQCTPSGPNTCGNMGKRHK